MMYYDVCRGGISTPEGWPHSSTGYKQIGQWGGGGQFMQSVLLYQLGSGKQQSLSSLRRCVCRHYGAMVFWYPQYKIIMCDMPA